jgi:hypothetical protein
MGGPVEEGLLFSQEFCLDSKNSIRWTASRISVAGNSQDRMRAESIPNEGGAEFGEELARRHRSHIGRSDPDRMFELSFISFMGFSFLWLPFLFALFFSRLGFGLLCWPRFIDWVQGGCVRQMFCWRRGVRF